MNLRYLEYFRVLAKTEHVTKAAELLHITQPSLSNAIREMERELGVPLVKRKGRNIVLTDWAKKYALYIERGFQEFEAGRKYLLSCAESIRGTVSLGFFHSLGLYFVPQLIQEFLANPQYRGYSFTYGSGNEERITADLKNGQYDIIFCSTNWADPQIRYYPVMPQRMRVIVSQKHRLAGREEISIQELQGERFISYSQPNGLQQTVAKILEEYGVQVEVVNYAEQGATIAGMVAMGFGVAILPDIPLPTLDICYLSVREPIPPRWVYLAVMQQRSLTMAAEVFLNFVLNYGGSDVPGIGESGLDELD